MKKIIFLLSFVCTFLLLFVAKTQAQSVSGVWASAGCNGSGTITVNTTGLGATPQYQLVKGATVIAPVSGDPAQYTNDPVFVGIFDGTYTIHAKASSSSPVVISAPIVIVNNYEQLENITPSLKTPCPNGTAQLITTLKGGKAPYIYSIKNSSSETVLQTSSATNDQSFTFNALPVGNYLISVQDACGTVITSASSITQSGVQINQISVTPVLLSRSIVGNCSSRIRIDFRNGLRYSDTNELLSNEDLANFTWRLAFNGQSYGKGSTASSNAEIGGPDFSGNEMIIYLPNGITDAQTAIAGNPQLVIMDKCGNTRRVNVSIRDFTIFRIGCANGDVRIKIDPASLVCFPTNVTFTNSANASDTHAYVVTSSNQVLTGLTPGNTYRVTYTDGTGYNSTMATYPLSTTIVQYEAVSAGQNRFGEQYYLEQFGYGVLKVNVRPAILNQEIRFEVIASNNPLVPIGHTITSTDYGYGEFRLPRVNVTDPVGYWPKGKYTLRITAPCGTADLDVEVYGHEGTLNTGQLTPVCGGFNYTMQTNLDPNFTSYEVIVLAGPSSVGYMRDFVSSTASQPFFNLSYGTYTFGLRLKGGTTILLQETITFDVSKVIIVSDTETGGYVCAAGDTNGKLTIIARSNVAEPDNVLQYALSTDGGLTFGPYQTSNIFNNLTNQIYYYKIKDGCGNEIERNVKIGVAVSPILTGNNLTTPVSLCNLASGPIQLDVDIVGAMKYEWVGPGITDANRNLKNPVIDYSDLQLGENTLTCTLSFVEPCNLQSVANLIIRVLPDANLVITNPAPQCEGTTVDLTSPAITAGSEQGLTLAYFSDADATVPLANPAAVATAGTYYIKTTNKTCNAIKPVLVTLKARLSAQISYDAGPYCKSAAKAVVTLTGDQGGEFTAQDGLVIDPKTGTVDLIASKAGTYTVTYKFTKGAACSDLSTASITINPSNTPSVLPDVMAECSINSLPAPSVMDACAGQIVATTTTVLPINTPGTTVVTWIFDYGNGYTETVTQNVIINPVEAPVVTVTQQPTCSVPTGGISVTPVAGFTYSVDGGAYTETTMYSNLAPGNHIVNARNSTGCIASNSITINPQPESPVTSITSNNGFNVINGNELILTATGEGTYQWTGENIESGQGTKSITIRPKKTGDYMVTVTNSSGCIATATVRVFVKEPIIISINYPQSAYCEGTGMVNIIGAAASPGAYTASPAGLSIDANTGTVNLAESKPGTYTITYTYDNGVIKTGATTNLTISALPVVNIVSLSSLTISKGEVVTLKASGGTTYEWTGADILSGRNTNEITARPTKTGIYTVQVTNASGCSEVASITVTVDEGVKLVPNNVITPNNDGKNDVWTIQNIEYYPNSKVSIYDRAGRKLFSAIGYQNNWDGTYNGALLNEDAYYYVIDLGKGYGLLRGSITIIRDSK
ncbi:gliding motility-associated C-terminal domain-containing protein [Pedobacter sp. MW01-1-1]|uniref:T9SS type B sorting domain-containing protein n=1 Tax=Pedobacter sp. MW01-1-1 TaxID=3383027 RepID=UPI003FEF843C